MLPALGLLLAAPPTGPNAFREAELAQAVQAIDSFQDGRAEALLKDVLKRKPAPLQAARAHVYLGLIALNELDTETAKARFRQAILDSVVVELPPSAPPKARLLFREVRDELMQSPEGAALGQPPPAQGQLVVAQAPAVPIPFAETGEPAPRHSSRLAAWITGAVAVAALGTGVGFAVAESSARNQAEAGASGGVTDANQETGLGATSTRDALVADVLFGVGAAAGVATVVLFLVPSGGSSAATVSLSATPGGFALRGGF
ncbi:MAG TPA: hypothetical protein VMB50_23945 [Myxococcales bacterium]|nr:hypothetical protein [Myxococcales bacterium]